MGGEASGGMPAGRASFLASGRRDLCEYQGSSTRTGGMWVWYINMTTGKASREYTESTKSGQTSSTWSLYLPRALKQTTTGGELQGSYVPCTSYGALPEQGTCTGRGS